MKIRRADSSGEAGGSKKALTILITHCLLDMLAASNSELTALCFAAIFSLAHVAYRMLSCLTFGVAFGLAANVLAQSMRP